MWYADVSQQSMIDFVCTCTLFRWRQWQEGFTLQSFECICSYTLEVIKHQIHFCISYSLHGLLIQIYDTVWLYFQEQRSKQGEISLIERALIETHLTEENDEQETVKKNEVLSHLSVNLLYHLYWYCNLKNLVMSNTRGLGLIVFEVYGPHEEQHLDAHSKWGPCLLFPLQFRECDCNY